MKALSSLIYLHIALTETYASITIEFQEELALRDRPNEVRRLLSILLECGRETDERFGLYDRRAHDVLTVPEQSAP